MLTKAALIEQAEQEAGSLPTEQAGLFLEAVRGLEVDTSGAIANLDKVCAGHRSELLTLLTGDQQQALRARGFPQDLGRVNGEEPIGTIGTLDEALVGIGADRLHPFIKRVAGNGSGNGKGEASAQ